MTADDALAKHRLEHAERMALLAHDAKNPLSAALTNLAFVSDVGGAEGEVREALGDALEAMHKLRALLDDAVTIARLEAGASLDLRGCDLAAIARGAVDANATEATSRRCTLRIDADAPVPIQGDPTQLTRAATLLVDAALRSCRSGAKVQVSAVRDGTTARLEVAIDARAAQDQSRVRALAERPTDASAAELGLPLHHARIVAKAHGGTLRVVASSAWPTVLSLELPA